MHEVSVCFQLSLYRFLINVKCGLLLSDKERRVEMLILLLHQLFDALVKDGILDKFESRFVYNYRSRS